MKYDKFTNEQRVDVAYDYQHHMMCFWDLVSKYKLNYNSTRDIVHKMEHKVGSEFKHMKMYCDLNNPMMFAMLLG